MTSKELRLTTEQHCGYVRLIPRQTTILAYCCRRREMKRRLHITWKSGSVDRRANIVKEPGWGPSRLLFGTFEGRLRFRPSGCKPLKRRTSCMPPLGTILQLLSPFQIVISGPRGEGRLFVRAPFVPNLA